VQRTRRGYFPGRSPDILPIPREPNYIGTAGLPVHTGPWDYLADVPLLVYGPGIVRAVRIDEPATMADVAPSIAGLIGFDGFDAPDGRDLSSRVIRSGSERPRLAVTMVWDGSGDDMLAAHSNQWPYLRKLMREGAMFSNMTIGSTPSNTPAIHTTLGTGAFPNKHGIVHVKIRTQSGGYVDPFANNDPSRVLVPSLADVYDKALDNKPGIAMLATVDWHLGMIGHGAGWPGGDRDAAELVDSSGGTYGNSSFYDVPSLGSTEALQAQARRLDAADGEVDDEWLGHDLGDPEVRVDSPAWVRYQQSLFPELLSSERLGTDDTSDLLFENFKSADAAGHRYGMSSKEVGADINAMDDALRTTVDDLNRIVGRGRWVLLLTADHGFTPYPKQSGAWPISGRQLKDDLNSAFDAVENSTDIVVRVTSAGIYVDRAEMKANAVTGDDIARWLIDYKVIDNASTLPSAWAARGREPLFDAALVGRRVAARRCGPNID
jgi:hypothetical protein